MKQFAPSIHLAAALFAGSMALRALGDIRGYLCAYYCLVTAVSSGTLKNEPGLWIYYTALSLANFAFIWVYFTLLARACIEKIGRITISASALLVFSWFFLNLNSLEEIGLGYYVWAASFALLTFISYKRKPEPNKALEGARLLVTDRAPSSTLRAKQPCPSA